MTRRQRDAVSCPNYVEVLGHFARVTIERDAARQEAANLKASREGWSRAHDRLLEKLGKLLKGDERAYLNLPTVTHQHIGVLVDVEALLKQRADLAPAGAGALE